MSMHYADRIEIMDNNNGMSNKIADIASDSASLSLTLRALQIKFTYLLVICPKENFMLVYRRR